MAYTADATNVATPADSDQARYAAAELRAIKARIIAAKAEAVAVADAAQAAADTAQAAADAAQSTADGAVVDAAAAQGTADSAVAAAAAAQGTAIAALAVAASGMRSAALAGTGSWTVPDGVTEVVALLKGGGTATIDIQGNLGDAFSTAAEGSFGIIRYTGLVAGSTIVYGVGVGETIGVVLTETGRRAQPTQVATQSFFGAGAAAAGIARYTNTLSTPMFYNTSPNADGSMPSLVVSYGSPEYYIVNTNIAGKAGSIILLYK